MMISRQSMAGMVAAGALVALVSPQAFADAAATIDVKLKVEKSCSVAATTNVDFGTQTVAAGATTTLEQGGTISLRCRKQADTVTVTLQKGSTNAAGGTMTSGDNSQAYTLYKPVTTTWNTASTGACQYTTAWDAAGLNLGTIGNSGTMLVGVCAKTTIDDSTAAGDYSDTLNVVLTY